MGGVDDTCDGCLRHDDCSFQGRSFSLGRYPKLHGSSFCNGRLLPARRCLGPLVAAADVTTTLLVPAVSSG